MALIATTTQLLDSLKDAGNQTVWTEFDARYRPVIEGVAMRLGLSPDDAAEVAQQTLAEFALAHREGKYDRSRGRLRGWIMAIARARAADLQRTSHRRRERPDEAALRDQMGTSDMERAWEEEEQRAIRDLALRRLRDETHLDPKTIRAFELTALRGITPETAAAECGMNVEQVYLAKNRVTTKLREIVEAIAEAYAQDA